MTMSTHSLRKRLLKILMRTELELLSGIEKAKECSQVVLEDRCLQKWNVETDKFIMSVVQRAMTNSIKENVHEVQV